jgi:hypothetical protein
MLIRQAKKGLLMVKISFTEEALKKLKEEGIKTLKVEVNEEVYEWTPCCGIGDACVVVSRAEVKEGKGGEGDVKLETVEGITIYVEPNLLSRAESVLTVNVDELGRLTVKGLKPDTSFELKPAHTP